VTLSACTSSGMLTERPERERFLAIAGLLFPRGLDRETASTISTLMSSRGHAGQFGADVGVVLVVVEIDIEAIVEGRTGRAGQRRFKNRSISFSRPAHGLRSDRPNAGARLRDSG